MNENVRYRNTNRLRSWCSFITLLNSSVTMAVCVLLNFVLLFAKQCSVATTSNVRLPLFDTHGDGKNTHTRAHIHTVVGSARMMAAGESGIDREIAHYRVREANRRF